MWCVWWWEGGASAWTCTDACLNACFDPLCDSYLPQLILADEDVALEVGSILVAGALRAGGPGCRLASRLTITFHALPGLDPTLVVSGCSCGVGVCLGEGWGGLRAGGRALLQRSARAVTAARACTPPAPPTHTTTPTRRASG